MLSDISQAACRMFPLCPAEFEPLLSWSFWLIPQGWSSTDPSLVYPSTMTTECYDEQLSDKCLTLLLGTWYEHAWQHNGISSVREAGVMEVQVLSASSAFNPS